jgi:hypothetical protein
LVRRWEVTKEVLLWESQAEIRDTEAVFQEATFYCASTDPVDSCPKAEPPRTNIPLYTLASRLQKQKAKLNPHMAACDFIGYFISPCFSSLSFISLLCHPFPLSHHQNTVCPFLFWLSSLLHCECVRCVQTPCECFSHSLIPWSLRNMLED